MSKVTELSSLERRINKPVSEWTADDIKKLYSENSEELKHFVTLSEIVSKNKSEEIYLLIAPRIQSILFNDALGKATKILEKYNADKATKSNAEKLKSELLNSVKNEPNYFLKLIALNLALTYFKEVSEFKLETIPEIISTVVKSTLSINYIENFSLCSNIMTEIVYPVRLSYFKTFKIDLFTPELLGMINKYEEYLNLLASEISEKVKQSEQEETKN